MPVEYSLPQLRVSAFTTSHLHAEQTINVSLCNVHIVHTKCEFSPSQNFILIINHTKISKLRYLAHLDGTLITKKDGLLLAVVTSQLK